MSYIKNSGISLLSETEQQKIPVGVFNSIDNYVSVVPNSTTLTYDFTSDSVGSSPIDWEPLSGTFTVQSASPSIFGGAKYTRCDGAGSIKIPNIVANGVYEFDLLKADTGNAIAVSFIDNTTTGYTLNILNTEAISLSKIGSTTLLSSAASYVANATWYRFKIVRNEANVFSVYIKSSVIGNYTLVSVSGGSGTNPITDATTLTSKYFSVTMGLNDCIANINISAAVGQFDLNGYERINDSQNRDFEATHFGSDLLSGWNFTSGWAANPSATIDDSNSFSTTATSSIYKILVTVGKTYKMRVVGTSTATSFSVRNAGEDINYSGNLVATFDITFTFIANSTSLLLRNSGAGTTDIITLTLQEVLSETNILPAQDFTSGWTANSGATINTATKFTTTTTSSIYKAIFTAGKTYRCRVAGYTTATSFSFRDGLINSNIQYSNTINSGSFDESFVFTPSSTTVALATSGAGVTEIFKMELYEIQTTFNDSYLARRRSGNFNGTDNRVDIADNVNLNFGANPFSISYFGYITYGVNQTIVSKRNSATDEYSFYILSNGNVTFLADDGTEQYISSNAAITQSGFYHIVVTRSPNALYINGVAKTLNTNDIGDSKVITNVGILRFGYTGASYTTLKAYDTRFFNRVLSASEVLIYYNGGKPELYRTPNVDFGASQTDLLGDWNFTSGWVSGSGVTIDDNNSYTSIGSGGIWKQLLTVGKTYRITVSGTTTATSADVRQSDDSGVNNIQVTTSLNQTTTFVATKQYLYIRNGGAGTTDIITFTLTQIGVVAEYKFNEVSGTTLRDYSLNGNHGTVNGTVTNFWQRENYGNHSFEISDVDKKTGTYSGKMISTGDGLGSDVVSALSWVNMVGSLYETFTSSNRDIASAINTTGYGNCYLLWNANTPGKTYRVTFTLTLNSGTAPYICDGDNAGGGTTATRNLALTRCINGVNSFVFTINNPRASNYLQFFSGNNEACDFSVTNFTVKEVLGNIELPASSLNPIVAGEKYTLEAWARGTGIVSATDLLNGWDFTNWTAVNATKTTTTFTNTSANGGIYKNILGAGKTYKMRIAGTQTLTGLKIIDGTQTITYKAISATTFDETFYFLAASNTNLFLYSTGGSGNEVSISTLTLQEVTLPTVTLAIGGQTKSISSISCVSGTFTKLVWNFQATANEVNQPIKIYANQADVIYYDDFSLTQAWDGLASAWLKNLSSATQIILARMQAAASTEVMFGFALVNSKPSLYIADGNSRNTTNLFSYNASLSTSYSLVQWVLDRTGLAKQYTNGIVDATTVDISGFGKLNPSYGLTIGARTGGSLLYNGSIGEVQITKFKDIVASNFTSYNSYDYYKKNGKYPPITGGDARIVYNSKINDGHAYQVKDNSVYKKSGVLNGTITEFWQNKPQYFEQEYTFKSSQISASSATTTLLKLPANVKVVEISADIEKFSSDVTLQIGYSGNDAWLATITGTNVNDSKGVTVDKAYSSLVEKQLYIKKSAATTYGRIKLRIKFEYLKEL